MIRIKICGITRPKDAWQAVRSGADAIGLIFAASPRQVTPGQAKKIIQVLPPYIIRVGVFVNQEAEWVKQIADQLGLDRLQFHGHETSQYLRWFTKSRVIRALRPKAQMIRPKNDPAPAASAFLVDAYVPGLQGGTGRLANWEYTSHLKHFGKPIILSGGLTADNVSSAVRRVKPDMVDVSSGVETKPGIKSAAKIRRFIKAVRTLT